MCPFHTHTGRLLGLSDPQFPHLPAGTLGGPVTQGVTSKCVHGTDTASAVDSRCYF